LAGYLAAEFFLARISIVPLLVGFARTFWGKRRLRVLAFPLCRLATMAPLPAIVYTIAVRLQLFASAAAMSTAQVLGASIYRQGNVI